jgi:hypothetical protein
MSSNQSLILDAIEARITALGTGRRKLKYSYDLEKNEARNESNSYGYGAASGNTVSGVMKSVTMDQQFFVVLSQKYVNRNGDAAEQVALKAIYDDMETIYTDFVSSKLGIAATVLVVEGFSLDDPEKMSDNTISIKASFNIKHRKMTT